MSFPKYWETQAKDANGNELEAVHRVTLNRNDPNHKDEYNRVSAAFNKTAKEKIISEIQRIQIPSMFELYYEYSKCSDEKLLF